MKQYKDLLGYVLECGKRKSNRTGVDTIGVFGHIKKFNMSDGFPLLTTKKMFWKGIKEELFWFLRGETNILPLMEKGCNFWNDDAYRNYQKKCEKAGVISFEKDRFLNKEETVDAYDLGYGTYGSMWRSFPNTDRVYGIDQIAKAIHSLRNKPDDRRIIVSAWHPGLVDKIALPPCHVLFQLNTELDNSTGERSLNLALFQRSCDLFLGVPFNIASYSLLLHILSHVCGYRPGTLTHFYGDLHIYVNHIGAVTEQLRRECYKLPEIKIHRPIRCELEDIASEDIELLNYNCHPKLTAELNTAEISEKHHTT